VPRVVLPNGFTPRHYQRDAMAYFDRGGKRGVYCWPRRSGKDMTFMHQIAKSAHERTGIYYHLLPNHKQARKVIWDAIDNDGKRMLDMAFPREIRDSTNEVEMKIRFKCGSLYQLVGADYYNSIMGSNPVGLLFSEAALTDPRAWSFFRPIIAANGGWAAFISTPRGYNWFHKILETAKGDGAWHWSHLNAAQTGHIPAEVLASEKREMEDELYRQEYDTDFSAANVGAILGRWMEDAEREGRITEVEQEFDGIYVSSDIGFRDTATWWFWKPRLGGLDLIDYDEDTGLDADDWIARLQAKRYRFAKIWLPHDARVKTFQSKHSAVERFLKAFGAAHVGIVEQSSISDRINAARYILPRCRFDRERTAAGLEGLRAWSYEMDEDKKTFSREPRHDWASHPGDGFSYGAQVMAELVAAKPRPEPKADPMSTPLVSLLGGAQSKVHPPMRSNRIG
jgi:phage terminase large subunit